jgi:hypothetical protein
MAAAQIDWTQPRYDLELRAEGLSNRHHPNLIRTGAGRCRLPVVTMYRVALASGH